MSRVAVTLAALTFGFVAAPCVANTTQTLEPVPVVAAQDVEALFTSPDPILHRNKQATYHILKDLLEAGHWELADQWMTERYIQHNPFIASGRQAIADFFVKDLKIAPKPIPEKTSWPIVSVLAEGDYVIVAHVRELPDPNDPSKTYTTTAFDMWRFVDGKADEHWDNATR